MTQLVLRMILMLAGLFVYTQACQANADGQSALIAEKGGYSQEGFAVSVGRQQVLPLGTYVRFFEDVEGRLSLDEVRALPADRWLGSQAETPNFGYTDSTFWFHVSLSSHDAALHKLLAIQYALLDHLELYVLDQGKVKAQYLTGDIYPFAQRPIRHRDFLFPVDFAAHQTLELWLKVETEGSLQVPLELWERDQFVWNDQDVMLIKAVYYGMMFVLMIYNLFLFLSIRERSYLYYGGLVLSMLMLMSGAHGFLYQYLYPNLPGIHKLVMLLAVPSVMLFAGLFAGYFLSLSKVAPRLNRLLTALNLLFLVSIAGAFVLPYDISTRISVFLSIPSSLVIMFAGPYAWSRGQESARYFTYAWAFLITGIVISASSKFGILPRTHFTEHALNWGSAIEALLLSFALADRFNRERQAKFKAQQAQLEEARQRKTAEQKLYNQATHQALDGFPNTVLLQQVLYRMMYLHESQSPHFSLIYLQLHGIAEITKTLGHENADLVLSLFSRRLQGLGASFDRALLIEAGEQHDYYFAHVEKGLFVHILKDVEISYAVDYAHELMQELSEAIEYNAMKLDIGLSMGIASSPLHGEEVDVIMRHARIAIDSADNANGNVGVYSAEINPYTERRLVLMGELKKAIDQDSLALHYQPILCSQTARVAGVEALLRWHHETLGFVPPDEFIGIAEQTGIMRYLSRWVLERALRDHARRRSLFGPSTVSVNISAVNLHEPDFESGVIQLLERFDIPPDELILEITETSVMKDPEYAISALKRLADRSIKLAIDDFGTGYSSLAYIQRLPLYEIKIDRSFIQGMDSIANDQVIVKTTLSMSRDLGVHVVAEGIENQAVLARLIHMRCDFLQGFFIARPMSMEAMIEWQQANKNDEFLTDPKTF
jgi:EAL domain-containing protein (putative c-di-GMP-specific phosphodiesterase class I)/GGDEF domain-containing protein